MTTASGSHLNTALIGHVLVAILLALLALWFLYWAFIPTGKVPHFRVLHIRIRLRLRLHPGRGFATAFAMAAHWSRTASYWASKRTRPGLTRRERLFNPSFHSVFMGRAHYRLGARLPIQEHLCVFGPPRAYKSGFFARAIMNYKGAVVATSTKGDMVALTAGVRQHYRSFRRSRWWTPWRWVRCWWGSAIYIFNPQHLGPFSSNIRWNLVAGCAEPAVAIRRAQALCEAASTEGTEEATFWSEQAAMQMRALLCAADLMRQDFRIVNHWILSGQTRQAEEALKKAGFVTWAAVLEQMRSGKAERTTATIRLVLSSAVAFMSDPTLAECVIPGPGDAFDIERFLMQAGSLYLIGEQRGQNSPIAPLFASLVTEIQFTAQQMAGSMKGQRLDPPVLFALDEVTQIVPIPLPSIVADSGGRGIQLIIAAHGIAQLRSRWGADGARTILDCCNLMVNPGVQDPDTLELAERLAGKEWFKVPGGEQREQRQQRQQLPIIPQEAVRQLPPKRSLVIRTWNAPVVLRLAMGWRDWHYLWARVAGYATPRLRPVPSLGMVPAEAVLSPMVSTEPVVPVSGDGADDPIGEPGLEPTPSGPSAHLAGIPQQRFAPAPQAAAPGPNGNGDGRVNGNGQAAGHQYGADGHSHPHPAGPQDGGPAAASDPWSE